jgi:alpha-L-fucosidase
MMTKRLTIIIVAIMMSMVSIAQNRKILYVGDSVTDGGWGNSAGHQLMANLWIKECNNLMRKDNRKTIIVTQEQLNQCPEGPFQATWQSVAEHYRTPKWFMDAKFGIFIHWGVYSVPAAGSEWYPKHMYNGLSKSHREKWGPQNEFGYKNFIPMFKAEKFDAEEWAQLFKDAGARYVIPTAEHHDGFAMYESDLTRWNAKEMGPCRDIIGELSVAVRHEGMKFGISNHRIENWDFMYPLDMPLDSTDLFDPEYADLYGPPQKPVLQSGMGPKALTVATDGGATEAMMNEFAEEGRHPQSDAFLNEWELRVREIIDRYQPDLIYFDNGINYRSLDPWKLRIARYYYNSAWQWKKDVSIQSKSQAYLAGSIIDFERESRAPRKPYDRYWQVDDPIGNKFGYIDGLKLQSAEGIIRNLIDNISCGGNLCLNVSPRSDGTIPDDQQQILRTIGKWLRQYGEAVYGTTPYHIFGEGTNIRYTCKPASSHKESSIVYAFVKQWDGKPFTLTSIPADKVKRIVSLETGKAIKFKPASPGIRIEATSVASNNASVAFRIDM